MNAEDTLVQALAGAGLRSSCSFAVNGHEAAVAFYEKFVAVYVGSMPGTRQVGRWKVITVTAAQVTDGAALKIIQEAIR